MKIKDADKSIGIAVQLAPEKFANQAVGLYFPQHDHPSHEPLAGKELGMNSVRVPLSKVELAAAIQDSKTKSTPGHDRIPYDIYKNMKGVAVVALLQVLNEVWLSVFGEISMDFKHSLVVP